jgi:hypothetical protein
MKFVLIWISSQICLVFSTCCATPSRNSSCYACAAPGPPRGTTACRYATPSACPWYPSSASGHSTCPCSGCWCLWCLEFRGDFATRWIVDEGRVGRQERCFHILWTLRAIQICSSLVGLVLWSLERFLNRCLRHPRQYYAALLFSSTSDHAPLGSLRKKRSCSCHTGTQQSSLRTVPDSRA